MRKFKSITIFLVLTLILSIVMPTMTVIATAPEDKSTYGQLEISGGVVNMENVTNGTQVTLSYGNNNSVIVTGTGLYSSVENGRYFIYATANTEVTVNANATEGYNANLWYNGTNLNKPEEKFIMALNTPMIVDGEFNDVNSQPPQQDGQTGEQFPPEGDSHQNNFDGTAYFVWTSNGKICYHKVTGLSGMKEDGTGYDMNYVNASSLTDESGNGVNYKWGQEPANWVLTIDMEDNKGNVLEGLTEEYIFGDGYENMGVQLNPTNAENGANSICSNGDMNFRVTIYRDNYQAIKFASKSSEYKYFPAFWDQTFFTSTVDISGTTAEKPAVYEAYLLEPTISFEAGENSKSNAITKVEALDVNPNAVTITKANGKYTIKFNSNYYDNVVFKITTADNNSYYVRIARVTFYAQDNFAPNQTKPQVQAALFYPTTNSYNDFEVVATIVNKDKSTETKTVSVAKASTFVDPQDADRIIDTYTLNGGNGLHACIYNVDVDKDKTLGVYFTVLYKGALEGKTFGGTFSGSGRGIYYDLDNTSKTFRNMVYDK